MREACATCEMGYVRAIYVFLMRLFLVHIDRHRKLHMNNSTYYCLQIAHLESQPRYGRFARNSDGLPNYRIENGCDLAYFNPTACRRRLDI